MYRILRCLVCLVLICCILINCSPIRAKAVAVEVSIAIGLIAMMILASAGVVYTANTTSQIQAIGNSFQTHMYQWGTSAGKLDEVDAFFNGLHLYDPGSGDDDETPHEKQVRLARGILAGITAWVASLALGMIEIEEDVTPLEGFEYYNGLLLPSIPASALDAYSHFMVLKMVDDYSGGSFADTYNHLLGEHVLFCAKAPFRVNDAYGGYDSARGYSRFIYVLSDNGAKWIYHSYIDTVISSSVWEFVWADHDLFSGTADALSSSLIYPGSESSSVKTEPILPNTYVGDIPDQLQSGELEPEDIPLPDINLEPYIEDGKLAPQKVIDTMSNLSTGALPYDQFLQQSTLPPEIDDGGTDSDSGTSSDTWQPPSNPGQFALDLTKYFPFCIPFDLYDLFTCLNADPVAPVIRWELPMPGGSTYPIELDLSPFNSVAQLLRRMQLLLFCVGLAIKTRDLIKG